MTTPIAIRGGLRLRGAGFALPTCQAPDGPRYPVSNEDVLAVVAGGATTRQQEAARRLIAASGVTARYWSRWIGGPGQADEPTAVDLAMEAVEKALADAQIGIGEVGLVIMALSTSTLATIATSTPLAARLGYTGPSFDLKGGCAGTLYALHLASQLAPAYGTILVVGADTMSRYVDATALMGFLNVGDGAGALVLGPSERPNWVSAIDGAYDTWDMAGVFDPLPPLAGAERASKAGAAPLDAEAPFTFRGTPTRLREAIAGHYVDSLRHILEAAETPPSRIAAWIPHQIAVPLLHGVGEAVGVTPWINGDRYGNTGAASLAIALAEARADFGTSRVALSALGGGMRWGSAVWEDWG